MVNGVVPLGLPSTETDAPAGRESTTSTPVVVPGVAGVAGAGDDFVAAEFVDAGLAVDFPLPCCACAASRTSSERDGRALVNITFCSSAM